MNTTTYMVMIGLPLGLICLILFTVYNSKGPGAIRKSIASILPIYEPDVESGQYNRAVRTILSNTDLIQDDVEKAIYYTLAARALAKAGDYRQALFSAEIATACYPKNFAGSYNKFQPYKDECFSISEQCQEKLDAATTKEATSAADSFKESSAKEIAAWYQVD